jgi:acyl dehydratase
MVTAEAIDAFAALTGDRFVIHMDDTAARARGFDGRVAHGLLVLSLVDGLKNQTPAQFDAIASLGWDWRFAAPVIAGDTISATVTVAAKRMTSRPDRGILTLEFSVRTEGGREVQRGTNQLMVAC